MDFDAARQTMVDTQIRVNDVTDPAIVKAFQTIPRELFVPRPRRSIAYSELEIETSEGRALWTARDFAKLLQGCAPKPSDIALIIGAGAGYETAILSQLVETAIGLECDSELVDAASARFTKLELDRAVAVEGDISTGLPDQAPFDLILVNGMVEDVPTAWGQLLAEGGRMGLVVQVDKDLGRARIYSRAGDTVSHRDVFDARPPKFDNFNRAPVFSF